MKNTVAKIALFAAALVVVATAVVVVSQTAQIVELAGRLHPVLGQVVLWGLLLLYAACVAVPIALFLRLPRSLRAPESDEGLEFERYLARLRRRLCGNPLLAGRSIQSRADIDAALAVLDERANEVIRSAANRVFLTTAIAQNGALDSLLVLALHTRLVWELAHVYHQRPTLRDMTYLYGNVAATAFVAAEIEDADLAEQIQPVVSSMLGSAAIAVPGLQAASSVFVNSVFSGTVNAFLTLRVGIIARKYCRSLTRPVRAEVRRSAFAEAAAMLGSIAISGARRLSGALVKASGKTVTSAVSGLGEKVRGAGGKMVEKLAFNRKP